MDRSQALYKNHLSKPVEISDGLVQRMTDGLGSNKYKPVDYDRLKAMVSEKRFGSIKTSMKVAKIEKKSQQHRENTVLKQHQLVWQKEFLRLQHLRKKADADIEHHMRNNRDSDICSQIYKDFDYCDAGLSADFDAFKKATADPVWNLRDDLRYWLTENREELKLGSPDVIEKHAEIRATVSQVQKQQKDVMEKLYMEQTRLENELQAETLQTLCPPPLEKHVIVVGGVPQEASNAYCPDAKLKEDVLNEFNIIDQKYQSMIEDLSLRHELALSFDECGDWNPDEHFQFIAIHDQYPRELPNRRALLFDRLKRHLPKRSRSSLSQHEDWWMDYKYYYERLKGIYADWARDRRELLTKVQMVFSEAAVAHELEEVRREYYHRQKQLCEVLYEKVREWREQKMEALQIEAQLNEERRQKAEEREALDREAEQKKRSKEKQKIEEFKQEQDRQRLEKEEAAEKRLKELKKLMAEQSVHDKERIHFREQQLTNKIEERRKKEQEKAKEAEDLEARLEALREQVRIIAESDPSRTQQPTKAWDARLHPEEEEEIHLMEPLFKMHGYTSKQITSDHRVKLETRLREAGLHNTDYARQVIRGATPPTLPRRDQQHTFKFKNQ
ncbi:coiled-coil domain-containing protein 148-like [Plakobranchus ocellatus]|uniref:Coiled-coil domain-containing protein 148-like n=1 Tax=Plakobranchus ocellatus TaxID=259542 RepID=A0AAV4E280_9GAST|nr:coiled-coil domain-containing protein 148-like [Plakobranchus ocellatus]